MREDLKGERRRTLVSRSARKCKQLLVGAEQDVKLKQRWQIDPMMMCVEDNLKRVKKWDGGKFSESRRERE